MKSIEILALGIRLVGIAAIFQLLQFFGYSATSIQQWLYSHPGESFTWLISVYGAICIVFAIMCFLLIKFPITVSRWLLPKTTNDEPVFNGSIDDLRIAAFTVMGVYILSWAVPDLFYNAGTLLQLNDERMMGLYNPDDKNALILDEIITIMEISIGLYLCLQAKGLNNLLLKLRGLGAK